MYESLLIKAKVDRLEAKELFQAGAKVAPVVNKCVIFFPVKEEHYSSNFLIKIEALCPPKPKVLLSATFTGLCCALFRVRFRF